MATASSGTSSADSQDDVVAFLESGDAFEAREVPHRIDTHCASVFLSGDRAWKLKRAVQFGYLDFSTPERRREALEAELRLNRRTAPQLYRAVHPIMRRPDGRLTIDGAGIAVDWLLEMQRFPNDALLDQQAARGRLDERLLLGLADRINAFHATAEPLVTGGGSNRFRGIVAGNIASMTAVSEILNPDQARLLGKRLLDLTGEVTPLLDSRGLSGRIRHAHGDLHLANIALIDDVPTLFDCLEFSTELATIDVLYDLAFLLMDLWHRHLRAEANIVFNRYLDLSPADEDAIALMPLFLAVRAAIRAHVLAAQSMRAGRDQAMAANARTYLNLALALIQSVQPRLIAIGGLSGTGKSSLARVLSGDIGRAPGARIFRNDVLRKRLAGLPPETRLPRSRYSEQAAARVYDSSNTMAAAALSLGQSVIADGVFARRDQRLKIEAVARKAGVGFDGLWLEAPGETRVARVGSRGADASDADTAVAQAQADLAVGDLSGWQRISAASPLDEVAAEARHTLKLVIAGP
jgi:aminoglycoside phosphotransferase family enzyme/predicted kinase